MFSLYVFNIVRIKISPNVFKAVSVENILWFFELFKMYNALIEICLKTIPGKM